MPGFQQRFGVQQMYRGGPNRRFQNNDGVDPDGEQFRKMFIGGLAFTSDDNSLREYFSKWGEIDDCVVMKDNHTKRSRGFGFITFKHKESVDEVQKDRKHKVDSRDVETKRAMPRDDSLGNNQITVNKMFLGGLKDDTTEDMIREEFKKYGNIKEVELIPDKNTGKIKGFGFVTFDDYDPVDKLVLMRTLTLNSKQVEMKKAFAKGEADRMTHRMNMGMGPGGAMPMGRGGRGDYAGGYNSRDFDRGYFGGYQGGPGPMGNNYGGWQQPAVYNDFFNHGGNPRGGYNNFGCHSGYRR